jgi:hypothetical protein
MKINLLRSPVLGIAATLIAIPGYAAAQASSQTMVSANATLVRNVNSQNAVQGQTVAAKLNSNVKTTGSMELPKGTMLMGKVEQVQMSSNHGPSKISLVFDQARLSDGHTVPVKATLLGAYPANAGQYYADTSSNGSLVAGQPHFIPADQKIDQEPGTLSHVSMHSSVESSASGVFMSTDRNVDLKKGTELQIAIAPATPSSGGMAGGQ